METDFYYIAIYKPYNVLCAFFDMDGRSTLANYISITGIDSVGRLDYDSEGLLLLTNDGILSHHLTHPDYEHPKTYLVQVEGVPDARALELIRTGIVIKGKMTRSAQVDIITEPRVAPRSMPVQCKKGISTTWLRVILCEGRKRQIRHMTATIGCPTLRLIRIAIGPVLLGDLGPGDWRDLCQKELHELRYIPRLLRQRSK
jgi:23S rRNA pseudouridine2457 synthase